MFLGCLSCSKYDADSVHNTYSKYGNKYGSETIFNSYGEFGSRYTDTGACNEYANDPPVVVDEAGNYYGRLTLNRYRDQVADPALIAWLAGVCADS